MSLFNISSVKNTLKVFGNFKNKQKKYEVMFCDL